jgi:hypothetical protein
MADAAHLEYLAPDSEPPEIRLIHNGRMVARVPPEAELHAMYVADLINACPGGPAETRQDLAAALRTLPRL